MQEKEKLEEIDNQPKFFIDGGKGEPYDGPLCEIVGINSGWIYQGNKANLRALKDAALLAEANLTNTTDFVVRQYGYSPIKQYGVVTFDINKFFDDAEKKVLESGASDDVAQVTVKSIMDKIAKLATGHLMYRGQNIVLDDVVGKVIFFDDKCVVIEDSSGVRHIKNLVRTRESPTE